MAGGGLPFVINIPWLGGAIQVPRSVVSGGALVIGVVILMGLIGFGLWGRQQIGKPAENIGVLYQQMVRLAGWMGVTRWPWQTPYEHAAVLQRNLPGFEREVGAITDEYVHQTFSRHSMSVDSGPPAQFSIALASSLAWSRLRPVMLKTAFKRRLPPWLRNHSR